MGINKLNQARLNQLYATVNHTLSIEEAANILQMPRKEIAKLMSRWVEQGHFSRVKRGLYSSIKPGVISVDADYSWIIATKLYSPCYIGALTAAEYWGLTNQKFPSTNVLSINRPKNRNPVINNIVYSIRTISPQTMFGLEPITHQQVEILLSDPSRTIIDFLVDPGLGGGIYNVIEIFNKYLKSEHKNMDLLFSYAKKILNGAVLKRLGYLLERCKSDEFNIIGLCHLLKTTGSIKLDPTLSGDKLITRWGLWV
ncbi:MAG: type IV toxin-antitoxin system AbiEi family antitoxin domain-containing protein [Gammaproteobacteria bacterium]